MLQLSFFTNYVVEKKSLASLSLLSIFDSSILF